MNLPFTTNQFLGVFEKYNTSVFPIQILFFLAAVILVYFALRKTNYSDNVTVFTLSFLWLWIGVVYQWIFFAEINPAAKGFGAIFVLQAIIFLWFRKEFSFEFRSDAKSITALTVILYALLIYPVIGAIAGHSYPRNPTFGLPCPTTIFTFGMLLLSPKKLPWYLYVLPSIWALIGFSAAIKLGILEDTGLIISAAVFVYFNHKLKLQTA